MICINDLLINIDHVILVIHNEDMTGIQIVMYDGTAISVDCSNNNISIEKIWEALISFAPVSHKIRDENLVVNVTIMSDNMIHTEELEDEDNDEDEDENGLGSSGPEWR